MIVKETYSEHIGVRVTPSMLKEFQTEAKKNHMPTAIWVRWVLLNTLDKKSRK